MLPVMLDVAGKLVVVVGGGAVGARKAAAALAAGAVARVVDPRCGQVLPSPLAGEGGSRSEPGEGYYCSTPKLASPLTRGPVGPLPSPTRGEGEGNSRFALFPEPYRPEHLDGAFLVFACATPVVNAQVVTDARARGILVCSATEPAAGDFTLPSVVWRGDLTLAVSTGGAAPALSRRIREKLEAQFDASFAEWLRVLAEVRAVVLTEVTDPDRRRELLDGFAEWSWLERLRAEGADAVRAAMLAAVRPT